MEHRSLSWRRKSFERNPGEGESSGSMSSHSELYSDDQEISRASSSRSTQSPEFTSKVVFTNDEVNEKLKSLREKLSAALINISVKEDLVKQHAKVAEEAVSGWEKAGNEAVTLKQQLHAAVQKNSALEDQMAHLDGALKECLRKLRQTREEQERKIQEAVLESTSKWESMKFELEEKLAQLQAQVEAAKDGDGTGTTTKSDLLLKLETAEKQNSALEHELIAQVEELEMMALERDLSTETAEIASKQHLESIKKVAKLEAECRKLRAIAHKASTDHKSVTSTYVESHTDSQSDIGERLLTLDTDNHKLSSLEPSCSDSWASALIVELDQFKNQKVIAKNITTSPVENDLMDDFLEMERLAALPQAESTKHDADTGFSLDRHSCEGCQHKADLEAMVEHLRELEKKLENVEVEKARLEVALAKSQEQLKGSQTQLLIAKDKLVELHRQLDLANNSKHETEVELHRQLDLANYSKHETEVQLHRQLDLANYSKHETEVELHRQLDLANYSKHETEAEMKIAFAERKLVESQLVAMDAEVLKLHEKVGTLETEVRQERSLSAEITAKCRKLENELSTKKREAEILQPSTSNDETKIKQERELAAAAGKFAECQKTIASLGRQLKSLATLDDFLIDSKYPLEVKQGSLISRTDELLNSSFNKETVIQTYS